MRGFWQLYKKDIESIWLTMAIFTLAIAGWDTFLYTRMGRWPVELAFVLSVIPLGFILLWMIWEAIQSYRHEWQTNGIYTLLSLPQPGWKLALAKLAAVLTSFTLQFAVAFLGVWILFWKAASIPSGMRTFGIPAEMLAGAGLSGWLAGLIARLNVIYWVTGLSIIVVVQAAYVISKLATRFQFLMLGAGLVVSHWLLIRIAGLGHYVFGWVPDITFSFPMEVIQPAHGPEVVLIPPQSVTVFLDSGPIAGWVLGLILLFAATARLLQDVIEV